MAARVDIPMTHQARDALITISVLWVLFAIAVYMRVLGRIRAAFVGADDVLSVAALVRCIHTVRFGGRLTKLQILSASTIGMSAIGMALTCLSRFVKATC